MGTITLHQIVDGIETALSAATGLTRHLTHDEIPTGLPPNDFPLLMVYPESGEVTDTETDRATFRGGARQYDFVVHADLYAGPVQPFGERMGTFVTMIDAMMDTLEDQTTASFFGLEGVRAFHWTWARTIFTYGEGQPQYLGARFVIDVRVF